MKRLVVSMLVAMMMASMLFIAAGCETEKTDKDWVEELRDKRTRHNAMLYVQEHKLKLAVPQLISLMEKRYSTLKAVYSLGVIGDPAAVPAMLEELDKVAKMDSIDNDRLTEQLCMSLGMIGDPAAVEKLIWTSKNGGEMGRAGAVQALGMIGDKRATDRLIAMLYDKEEKITIRHYVAIALGRIKDPKAVDALVYGLYVDDKSGLNLFRDCQLALLQIGGKAARDALIKGYKNENEKMKELVEKIKLPEGWRKVKLVNVMGQLRDGALSDFLVGELEKALKDSEYLEYEVIAKIYQALSFTPMKKEQLATIMELFLQKPPSTAYLNEKEIMKEIFIRQNYTEKLDEVMKVAESGDIRLRNAQGRWQEFSQYCFAAANVVSLLGGADMADRFDEFVKSGKCSANIFGLQKPVKKWLEEFNLRMKAKKECKENMACWVKKLDSNEWSVAERAIYELAFSGKKQYMNDIIKIMAYPNEMVRNATVIAVEELVAKEHIPVLIRFWRDQKINKEFQKPTENIGYVIHIKMREFGLDSPEKYRETVNKAEKATYKGKDFSALIAKQNAEKARIAAEKKKKAQEAKKKKEVEKK